VLFVVLLTSKYFVSDDLGYARVNFRKTLTIRGIENAQLEFLSSPMTAQRKTIYVKRLLFKTYLASVYNDGHFYHKDKEKYNDKEEITINQFSEWL